MTRAAQIEEWLNESLAYDGIIVEIGGGSGETTQILAKPGRTVFVVDPYEGEMPKGYFYDVNKFFENTHKYANIELIKKDSRDIEVYEILKEYKVCFMFIDGLQYMEAVLSDLELAKKLGVKVIVLDDIDRHGGISQVPQAVDEFLLTNKYNKLISDRLCKLS